jgi:uncharacterized repeat protein (TIGR03803 family)
MTQKRANQKGLSAILALAIATLWAGTHSLKAYSFQEIYRFPNAYPSPSGLTLGPDGAFYGTSETDGTFHMGYVFRVSPNGVISTVVSFAGTNGSAPLGGLVRGNDGALYGAASQGGAMSMGTVFRVTPNGELTTIISFTGTNGPNYGNYPYGIGLGADGALYGSTYGGGIGCDCGTAFRVTADGQFNCLGTLDSSTTGGIPNGALTQGADGAYYGTTSSGGPGGNGTIFRAALGQTLTAVANFSGLNGAQPLANLTRGFDGALYGTTYFGGTNDGGTIFKFDTNGVLTVLHHFYSGDTSDGYYPEGGLLQADDGTFYGTAQLGGSSSYDGVVFKITPDGTYTRLVTFTGPNGASPIATLIFGLDGALYGTTTGGGVAGAGTVFRMTVGGTLTTLAPFRPTGGGRPNTTPLQLPNGMLYGTTSGGGTNGMGTVFALSTNGTLAMVVSFDGVNGSAPSSPLILGADGNLYGTAGRGGVWDEGTFYRVTTNGVLTALANFDYFGAGAYPSGPMCIGSDGAFYGTANGGGSSYLGAVFRATTNGSLTAIASFDNTHGAYPQNGLIRGADSAFYGTTTGGGTNGGGVVFRVTTGGSLSALTSFNPAANLGTYGRSTLVQSTDGTLYGTTYLTGAGNSGYGTVFKVTTNGLFAKLTTLQGYPKESYPTGPLVIGPDQALYGTTISGGQYGTGSLYRITTNGAITTLVSFWGYVNGEGPISGVMLGQNNKLYATCADGQGYAGTVWSVDLSTYFLAPPVKQGNNKLLSFSVIPNALYRIQRAGNPNGPWSNLANVGTSALSGLAQYIDTTPPPTNAFYRLTFR